MVSIKMKTGILITIGIVAGIITLVALTVFIIPTMEANHQRECLYDGGKVTGFLQCTRVHMDYSLESTTVRINLGALDPQSKNPIFPKKMTVVLGENNTVTWLNTDGPSHFINFDDFAIGPIRQGERQSFTFNHTGVYKYFSAAAPSISGSVIVKTEFDKSELENHGNILDEINQQAIIHQENGNQGKFKEQVVKMQEKITEIARDSFGLNIYMSDVYQGYFPMADASKVEVAKGKESFQICDVAENIPIHLQNIAKTKKFQMFAEKYSDYPMELNLQDERRSKSSFHYGLIANSDDGRTALTFFHADSCTNQMTDSERYYLSCHDNARHHVFGTVNKEDILASLSHPDFCTIPLDSWRQSVYEYNQKIKEQLENHLPTIEALDKSYESVSAYQLESHRLDLLGDISSMYVMAVDDEQEIEEKIKEYNDLFGPLPDELLKLIEQRK